MSIKDLVPCRRQTEEYYRGDTPELFRALDRVEKSRRNITEETRRLRIPLPSKL